MAANQMHIHSLINQLALNGYTNTPQNAMDSLGDAHSFSLHPRHFFLYSRLVTKGMSYIPPPHPPLPSWEVHIEWRRQEVKITFKSVPYARKKHHNLFICTHSHKTASVPITVFKTASVEITNQPFSQQTYFCSLIIRNRHSMSAF